MAYEWDLQKSDKMVLALRDCNGYVRKYIDGVEGMHGGNSFGIRNIEGRMLLEFCDEKELCVANTGCRQSPWKKF